MASVTSPLPTLSAVSSESATRRSMPGFTTSRSMTTSIECFFFLSRSGSEPPRSTVMPSMRARTKPSFAICASCFLYSPFLPRT